MSMYDRDWYRESLKEERRKQKLTQRKSKLIGIIGFILIVVVVYLFVK